AAPIAAAHTAPTAKPAPATAMRFTSGLNPATSPAAAAVMTDTAVALNVAATPLSAPPAIKANTPLKKAADGFRHTVASPDVVGLSTLTGAAVGAVIGFGVGFLVAPLVGAVGVGIAAIGTAACAAATSPTVVGSVLCIVAVPLLSVIAVPLATVASPIIGAVIGGVIGATVGAGIGASYASAPVKVSARKQANAKAKLRAAQVDQLVGALPAPVAKAAATDPTAKQLRRNVDRLVKDNSGLAQALDFVTVLVPQKAEKTATCAPKKASHVPARKTCTSKKVALQPTK
ncbi:MAG TPA: hypothetical protein PK331_10530, partial [Gordonia sp. (in: high G+C Gram-positive bacteria)]|nr:hypothetical protein [Gordonia sp. (in: high G+C Gram-positive bacteria)]